jgi:hypothetical protein
MAGALVKIEEKIISSPVASVELGGANWDSSYDVYKVVVNNVVTGTDTKSLLFRHLDTSNNPITTSNYDVAFSVLRTDTTFEDAYGSGSLAYIVDNYIGTGTGEVANAVLYLFNSNNATEFTYHTVESVYRDNGGTLRGVHGGGVLDSAVATKGISMYMTSGNINSGSFTIYGLKKS